MGQAIGVEKMLKPEPDKLCIEEINEGTNTYIKQDDNLVGKTCSTIPITTLISDSSKNKTLKTTMTNETQTNKQAVLG